MKYIGKKGAAATAVVVFVSAIVAIGLTEYGIAKGLPAPISFIICVAALFGLFVLKVKG